MLHEVSRSVLQLPLKFFRQILITILVEINKPSNQLNEVYICRIISNILQLFHRLFLVKLSKIIFAVKAIFDAEHPQVHVLMGCGCA